MSVPLDRLEQIAQFGNNNSDDIIECGDGAETSVAAGGRNAQHTTPGSARRIGRIGPSRALGRTPACQGELRPAVQSKSA